MSMSSSIDHSDVNTLVRSSLATVNENWNRSEFENVPSDWNLFDHLDSFAIVELLMQTETDVEKATGRYIALADESILDPTTSPLRRFNSWVEYVAAAISNG